MLFYSCCFIFICDPSAVALRSAWRWWLLAEAAALGSAAPPPVRRPSFVRPSVPASPSVVVPLRTPASSARIARGHWVPPVATLGLSLGRPWPAFVPCALRADGFSLCLGSPLGKTTQNKQNRSHLPLSIVHTLTLSLTLFQPFNFFSRRSELGSVG